MRIKKQINIIKILFRLQEAMNENHLYAKCHKYTIYMAVSESFRLQIKDLTPPESPIISSPGFAVRSQLVLNTNASFLFVKININ